MIIGGAALVVAAAIWLFGLLVVFGSLFFSSVGASMVSAVLLLGATGVLAFGICGESGIAGASRIGQIALVLFGARNLVFEISTKLPLDDNTLPVVRITDSGLTATFAIAAVVAAVTVIRAEILRGLARWVLAAVSVCYVIITALTLTGSLEAAYILTITQTWAVLPLSLLVLGAAYLFQGLSTLATHRRSTASEKW